MRVHPGRYVIGIAGLALVRHWLDAEDANASARVSDIRRLLGELDHGQAALELDLPELEGESSYAAWAPSYDATPNPLIRIEEPLVRAWIDDLPPGRALDAACGTGRHAGRLAARGHRVVGVDCSREMLSAARAKHPGLDFREGHLTALPLEGASVEVAVCALSLAHLPDLAPAFAELARVVRPGGRVIISDLHPSMLLLGGGALFQTPEGNFALVRSYRHGIADYVTAAAAAGLTLRRCAEPRWRAEHIPLMAGPLLPLAPAAFESALVGLPGALLIEFAR